MAGFGGLGLKEDLVELSLDIDALVSQVNRIYRCIKSSETYYLDGINICGLCKNTYC